MDIRAMCLGAINNKNKIYKINYNEDNILPYPVYSLNTKVEPILFNESVFKVKVSNHNQIIKNHDNLIVVQASDSTISNPTLYEYYSYKDIIKCLTSLNYSGRVLFVFHPANSYFNVITKKLICTLLKNYYNSKYELTLLHRKGNIESLVLNAGNVISIDYSQSFKFILSKAKKLVNFNRNESRLYGPIKEKYYTSGQYSDVTNYLELYEKLIHNINFG